LFARSPGKVKGFIRRYRLGPLKDVYDYSRFLKGKYDVIISCVGLGTPVSVKEAKGGVFELTEKFDNLVLDYLRLRKKTLYINFSSGAVYNIALEGGIGPQQYYGIAKLYQEARHRALKKFNIVDIRLYSYFSRFVDPDSGFFLTEVLKSIRSKKVFRTDQADFVRDFLSPQDLFNLLGRIIRAGRFNGVVEAYSRKPVTKFKLLEYFAKNYALKYVIDPKLDIACPTGRKSRYCPRLKDASRLGYRPGLTSLETVAAEARHFLASFGKRSIT
jgi:hypothetical protein